MVLNEAAHVAVPNRHTGAQMFTLSLRRLPDLQLHPEAIKKRYAFTISVYFSLKYIY